MEITVVSAADQFREAVAMYEREHGFRPARAVLSRRMLQRLINDAGPLFKDTAEGPLRFDGIILEVAGE
ncbi:MAG TPA: hypothetical protein PKZ27_02900 [Rhodocyclaceae bacterium]|nr:hypothetical protein [Burkholderiaceae bacterium]HRP74514.1 hypothetical protein [Rhodocyclaceae bacterium]